MCQHHGVFVDIDECESNPCPENSECEDDVNGYECICDDGWTGPDCETGIYALFTNKIYVSMWPSAQ